MEKKDITRRLAAFVVNTKYEDLPPEALRAAKLLFMDTLGCGIAGSIFSEKEVNPVIKVTEEMGGKEECTLLVSGKKSSWFNAILINGTLIHSIDYDDTRPGLSTHIGTALVSSNLAMSEKLETSGIAADQVSGLKYCVKFGDLTKSLHAGLTSAKGALSAMLAKHGATGPKGILEYPIGYCNVYSKEPKSEKIVDGLGNSFDIVNNAPKFYPTIIASHCAIAATLKLVKENDISSDEVLRVDEKTYRTSTINPNPETVLAARLSTPYCIAVAILDREVGMKQFEHKRLQDPRIKELIGKIHIETDQDFRTLRMTKMGMYPSRITITTKDGRFLQQRNTIRKGFQRIPFQLESWKKNLHFCVLVFWTRERFENSKTRFKIWSP